MSVLKPLDALLHPRIPTTPPSSPNSGDTLFLMTMQELARQPSNVFGSVSSICSLVGIKTEYMEKCIHTNEKLTKGEDYVIKDGSGMFVRAPVLKLMVMRVCMGGDVHTTLCRRLLRYLLMVEKKMATTTTSPPASPKRQRITKQVFYTKEKLEHLNIQPLVAQGVKRAMEDLMTQDTLFIEIPERYGALEGIMTKNDTRAIVAEIHPSGQRVIFTDGVVRIYTLGVLSSEKKLTTDIIEEYATQVDINMFRVPTSKCNEVSLFLAGKLKINKM